MKRDVDVFGFEELEKDFKKMQKKYPDEADALLMSQGAAVRKRVKALSPVYSGTKKGVKPGQLRKSWTRKKVKLYEGGTTRVVRIESAAPHSHLVEYGHENVRGGKTRRNGRTLNTVQRRVRGITSHGRTEGKFILEKSISEARKNFEREFQKTLDRVTKDLEV